MRTYHSKARKYMDHLCANSFIYRNVAFYAHPTFQLEYLALRFAALISKGLSDVCKYVNNVYLNYQVQQRF